MKTEQTTDSEVFSWNRKRSVEEINDFISRKLAKFTISATELESVVGE